MPDYPLIQGTMPGSWQEVYFAWACDKMKIDYIYQYSMFGGRRVRGGIVVDFVVMIPFQTPVEIYGRYWHEGALAADDKLKLNMERQYFKREPIIAWDYEIETKELAEEFVRREVLRR